jgi:hypothetical protein
MFTLNTNQQRTLVITLGIKLLPSKSIISGSIDFFKLNLLAIKPRLNHGPLFLHVNNLGINLWNLLLNTFGLILPLKEPVEVLLLLTFLLESACNLAQLLDFADKSEEVRALHVGKRVVNVGRELLNEGDDEGIEVSQLLLSISEEIVKVLLVKRNARRN